MTMTAPNSWERQDYDTEESWACFQVYRDQRPPRRLALTPGGVFVDPAKLRTWYKDHAWGARVEAYDRWVDEVLLEEREALLRQSAQAITIEHMTALGDARELASRELSKYLEASRATDAFGLLKPRELTALLETVIKYDRLIREQSTERTETKFDLSGLDVSELRELEALTKKAAK